MNQNAEEVSQEAQEFDKAYVHNYGQEKLIKKGAVALCGAVSTYTGDGVPDPLLIECCPICLALFNDDNN